MDATPSERERKRRKGSRRAGRARASRAKQGEAERSGEKRGEAERGPGQGGSSKVTRPAKSNVLTRMCVALSRELAGEIQKPWARIR